MRVCILKHHDLERPGLIKDCLKKENISYLTFDLNSGVRLPRVDDLNGIIILGGPMNVYEEGRYPFLREEDLFIKEAIQRGKSVLGICLGAQLIAKALGAKVFRAPVKEIGWYDVSLTEEGSKDPFFSHLPKTFPVFQWHEDTFEIPSAARLLATSTSVPHQAFRYGENAYGLQFHLEVTDKMIREWLKDYDEEFENPQPAPFSRAEFMAETKEEIEAYTQRGVRFFTAFFRRSIRP